MKSHSESSEISMKTSSRVVKGLSTSTEKFISLFAVTMFGSFQFIPLRDELPVVMIPCLRREILQGYRTNAMPFFFFQATLFCHSFLDCRKKTAKDTCHHKVFQAHKAMNWCSHNSVRLSLDLTIRSPWQRYHSTSHHKEIWHFCSFLNLMRSFPTPNDILKR